MKYPVHNARSLICAAPTYAGYQVWATDGDFGTLEGFVMDAASWHLGYLDVKSGDWLQIGRCSSPPLVQSVSWTEFRIHLHHTKEEA